VSGFVAGLLALLVMSGAWLIATWQRCLGISSAKPFAEGLALGFLTNFFDTLGIGSFAPTTAYARLRRLVRDEELPGTLNVGHALPTIAQALIFIVIIAVDPWLLGSLISAAVFGALVGVRVVTRLPTQFIQLGMGCALLIAASIYSAMNLGLMPGGGAALALAPAAWTVAVVAHVLFGALNTLGIGLYAPSLVLLSLLGLSPVAAFPIMMGACALLMPAASQHFLRTKRLNARMAASLCLGGIPAVLLAAFVVKSLPVSALRWGVVVVVTYAAISLLRTALGSMRAGSAANSTTGAAETSGPRDP
jgi:uncharacterized membrane protein YfcA